MSKKQPRLCNGRFARPIDSERDHAKRRISYLEKEKEKWYRAYLCLADSNVELAKKLKQAKEELAKYAELANIVKQLKLSF